MDANPIVAVLDTDIGSDVDDILALTLLLQSPEVELLGVTTVYGDTVHRARTVRYVTEQLDKTQVVVAPGERETLTGRPVWWSGHEGKGVPGLEEITFDESVSGVEYLCAAAREHAGELVVFAIGPLTNVAHCIKTDPTFTSSVRHLYIMGGVFWGDEPKAEHNIACDPEAADVVFGSGIPMTVCGLDVTRRVWLRPKDVAEIETTLGELGSVIGEMARTWIAYKTESGDPPSEPSSTNLHDPLAVLAALHPELFAFQQCDATVDLSEENAGQTRPVNCGVGRTRIAVEVDVAAAEREMMRRITAARHAG